MTTLCVPRNKGILSTYKSMSGQYVCNEAMIIPQISPINKSEGKFIIAVKKLYLNIRPFIISRMMHAVQKQFVQTLILKATIMAAAQMYQSNTSNKERDEWRQGWVLGSPPTLL